MELNMDYILNPPKKIVSYNLHRKIISILCVICVVVELGLTTFMLTSGGFAADDTSLLPSQKAQAKLKAKQVLDPLMVKSAVIIFALFNIFILLFGLRVFMLQRMVFHKVFHGVLIVDILTSIALMLVLDW
jgi:hypothetical protein